MIKNVIQIVAMLALAGTGVMEAGAHHDIQPVIEKQFIEKAKQNTHWKTAFVTGKHEQIVFMNVSPATNPSNEIGMEEHSFDQVILIVEGRGNLILNNQSTSVKEGDMIFIPQGMPHNIINQDQQKGLKLISFYSDTDIPKGAIYKTKADAPQE